VSDISGELTTVGHTEELASKCSGPTATGPKNVTTACACATTAFATAASVGMHAVYHTVSLPTSNMRRAAEAWQRKSMERDELQPEPTMLRETTLRRVFKGGWAAQRARVGGA
jgi:hypothetical protein